MAAGSGGNLQHGVKLSHTSPAFLHSNSTSHTWPFSALAELVDNAYDPDVAARQLSIDVEDRMAKTCLIFTDNGNGMTPDKLHKMLSFGYCEKVAVGKHKPVGHYGNGFKSGSMRLADDAIVFTKNTETMSVGFLSQSYLKAINATTVLVPMVTWNVKGKNMVTDDSSEASLEAITQHSLFRTEKELLTEFEQLNIYKTGTRIILYNLKRGTDDKLELDLESNSKDIINSERQELDLTSVHRQVAEHVPEHVRSFREYLSILFLKPRMKIMLRDFKVKTKLISKSLSKTETDIYRPQYLEKPIKIIFGFNSSKHDFGMMMYHRNRLIKAYEHVGVQKQANEFGVGVVGVVEVDFLEPVHNKQDFNKTDRYNSCIAALGLKLNDYWNTKTVNNIGVQEERLKADWTWVQCDNESCLKWRRLPDGYTNEGLPEKWFCYMNPDRTHNRCDIEEEPEDEDELQTRASYNKVKKKSERTIADRQSFEPLAASSSAGRPTVADLQAAQRALQEAKQREAEQQSLIAQLQSQRGQISQGQRNIRNRLLVQDPRMTALNHIGRSGSSEMHRGSQPSQLKRKVIAKEKIQLPGGDAVIVTRNDTTASSSDTEDETPQKRQKKSGLIVKLPHRRRSPKPVINGETVIIDSDDDDDIPAPSRSKENDTPDVKPDIEALEKSVKKEPAGTPKKSPARSKSTGKQDGMKSTKFVNQMVQTDLSDKPSTSTENGDIKDVNLQQLEKVKSQLSSLRNNVGKLLQTILPDLVVDDLEYIDAIVREMVRVNKGESTEDKNKSTNKDSSTPGRNTAGKSPGRNTPG